MGLTRKPVPQVQILTHRSFLYYGVGQYRGPVGLSLGSVLSLALRAGQRPQTELILEKDGALAPHRLVQALL